MTDKFRCHPLSIWDYAKPLLLVWLLPLINSVIKQVFSENAEVELFLEGASIVGIWVYSFLKWRSVYVFADTKGFRVTKGRFFQSEINIDFRGVSTINIAKKPLNLIFGGATVHIYTAVQPKGIKLRLKTSDADKLTQIFANMNNNAETENNILDVSHET